MRISLTDHWPRRQISAEILTTRKMALGVTLQTPTGNGIIVSFLPVRVPEINIQIFTFLLQQFSCPNPDHLTLFVSECKVTRMERNYFASTTTTVSGYTCQAWASQSPHPHGFTDSNRFPDASLEAASNFCRNPDNKPEGPWCYTVEKSVEWEYCNIPICSGQWKRCFYLCGPGLSLLGSNPQPFAVCCFINLSKGGSGSYGVSLLSGYTHHADSRWLAVRKET